MFTAKACILLLPNVEGMFFNAKLTPDIHGRLAIFYFYQAFNLLPSVDLFFDLNCEFSPLPNFSSTYMFTKI
jgi:hypothetical protein